MGRNADGTARCDRCGIWLPGYGVIHGLVCTDLNAAGTARDWILCYVNNCRTIALAGLVHFPDTHGTTPPRCTECDEKLSARAISDALLTVDIQPGGRDPRYMQFCYVNGSRDLLLNQIGTSL